IERLRSSIPRADKPMPETEEAVPLSPNVQQAAHHVEPPPQLESAPRSIGVAAAEAREPKLDFLFRPRAAPRPVPPSPQESPQQEPFDSLWPKRSAREAQAEARLEVARAVAGIGSPQSGSHAEVVAPSMARPERSVAILKSGVVDGMAYTLYADG